MDPAMIENALTMLKTDPANAGLLERIGNIYDEAQQFPTAIAC
jgi:hypothetical protein